MKTITQLEKAITALRIDYVVTYLLQNGHTQEEIANISDEDLISIYSCLAIKETIKKAMR